MENSQLFTGIIDKLKEKVELRSVNDFELHVKEFKKRGTRREIERRGNNSAGSDRFKGEILAELRRVKYHDL